MQFEEFTKLSDEDKKTYFDSLEASKANLAEREIEVNSLTKELSEVKETNATLSGELKSTKELNYTMARQLDTSKNKQSFEDALIGAFTSHRKDK